MAVAILWQLPWHGIELKTSNYYHNLFAAEVIKSDVSMVMSPHYSHGLLCPLPNLNLENIDCVILVSLALWKWHLMKHKHRTSVTFSKMLVRERLEAGSLVWLSSSSWLFEHGEFKCSPEAICRGWTNFCGDWSLVLPFKCEHQRMISERPTVLCKTD